MSILKNHYLYHALSLILIGVLFLQDLSVEKPSKELRDYHADDLISPLLDCSDHQYFKGAKFTERLKKIINQKIESNDLISSSIYFKDLVNGPTLITNPKALYNPASLTKVPLYMTFIRYAQDHSGYLEKKLRYKSNPSDYSNLQYPPSEGLVDQQEYTIGNLLFRLLVASDNGARRLLIEEILANDGNGKSVSKTAYDELFSELFGKDYHAKKGKVIGITASEIAMIFRVLYNATFLNRKASRITLNVLTQSEFRNGIKRYLPKKVKVANKFGEGYHGSLETKDLHECGIVYHPKNPYLLCVMTRGKDFSKQLEFIAEISQSIYQEVSQLEIESL